MEREPQRTIREVMVEGERGNLLRVEQLQAMSPDEWGMLRDSISDRHNGGEGIAMRCLKCGHPVYIRAYSMFSKTIPGFVHFEGGPVSCPWYQGKNRTPDSLKAEQYNGQQESPQHKMLCEKIGELASLDSRHIRHSLNEYHKPRHSEHGRKPDVYVEWEGFGPFVIELQLSNTFQTEISGRCMYYSREGIPLIWVLHDINELANVPQSLKDVIRRHRNNAFVIDRDSIEASYNKKTIVFKCYRLNGDTFESPELVQIDSLTIPEKQKLPYHKDYLSSGLKEALKQRRKPFFDFFTNWEKSSTKRENIIKILNTLPEQVPDNFIFMIAAAFSIVETHHTGKDKNYASGNPNVRAMLNNYLISRRLAPYSDMLGYLIGRLSPASDTRPKITNDAVMRELTRRKADTEQVGIDSPEWRAMMWLLPEAFDECERELLRCTEQLPKWVKE